MVIDTHAHYTYGKFKDEFIYLGLENGEYVLLHGMLENVFSAMDKMGIAASIEPGIDLASNERILELSRRYPSRVFPAIGVHPTRCIKESWKSRKKLAEYVQHPNVVAIGEMGLDYHYSRKQHRFKQLCWFVYQLRLARKKDLPVILHVRDAHKHAAMVLSIFSRGLKGVVHCFKGNSKEAMKYVSKGLYLGIGGSILQSGDKAEETREAVRHIPIERILVETDSPFVPPDCGDSISKKKVYKKVCNSSLILPKVIKKIAELKNMDYIEVERITAKNAIELFNLPISED